jgi:MoxR-like ATPase
MKGEFMDSSIQEVNAKIREASSSLKDLTREIGKVIVGQQYLVDRLLMALLADGHILIEGVPGLAKTLSVRTLSQALRLNSSASNSPRTFAGGRGRNLGL